MGKMMIIKSYYYYYYYHPILSPKLSTIHYRQVKC